MKRKRREVKRGTKREERKKKRRRPELKKKREERKKKKKRLESKKNKRNQRRRGRRREFALEKIISLKRRGISLAFNHQTSSEGRVRSSKKSSFSENLHF